MSSDDLIAVCSECKSDQPDHYIENSPFYRVGASVPCRFCGGVTVIVSRSEREFALKQADRERGLT